MSSIGLPWLLAAAFAVSPLGPPQDPVLEGDAQRRALLAKIQGKPAPALQVSGWINSKPLDLASLKGKVVMLDFWGVW